MQSSINGAPRHGQRVSQDKQSSAVKHRGESLFVQDRKGDRRNLEYGEPDRHAVPRYHAAGKGALIGAHPKYRIASTADHRYKIVDIQNDSARRSRKQSLLAKLDQNTAIPIKSKSTPNTETELQQDFLRFESHKRKKRRLSGNDPSGESDSHETGSESDSDQLGGDAFNAFKNEPSQQRHMQLSRATTERPSDADAWLEFVDHQDVSSGGPDHVHSLNSTPHRSLIDLKISVYEQGLTKVKDQEGRQKLIIGMMREGAKVWDIQKQNSQWQTFLKKGSSFDLWVLYLNFKQTAGLNFAIEESLKVYQRCLEIFRSSENGKQGDSRSVYLLLRLTLFLWQADYTERAIGIWQAVLELNLFKPSIPDKGQLHAAFEQFWASEVARIGDEGATGWKSSVSPQLDFHADRKPPGVHSLGFKTWSSAEADCNHRMSLPARSLDDVDEDDPYRIVLFPDVEAFLVLVTGEGLVMLVDAFLLFCGLRPASPLPEPNTWKLDSFVYSSSDWAGVEGFAEVVDPLSLRLEDVTVARNSTAPPGLRLIQVGRTFVKQTLRQLANCGLPSSLSDILQVYVLKLEASIHTKATRKLAKSFLKHKPESLRLYNFYALLEFQSGNLAAAERIWSTALSMRRALSQDDESFACQALRDWASTYLSQNMLHRLRVLLACLHESQIDPNTFDESAHEPAISARIKAQQYIKSQFEHSLVHSRQQELVATVDLLAMMEYVYNDCSIDSVLQSYDKSLRAIASAVFKPGAPTVQSLHEHRALLIHAHATALERPYKPKHLKSVLADSLQQFPASIILLQLHHIYAQKSGVIDRLRDRDPTMTNMYAAHKGETCVVTALSQIRFELGRPSYSGSTNYSIRSCFKHAIELGSQARHNIDFWTLYVLWEASVVTEQPLHMSTKNALSTSGIGAARMAVDAFYASVQACPWAKELYMLSFSNHILADAIGTEGLKQIYQSMLERGLRLRLDMSGNLEG